MIPFVLLLAAQVPAVDGEVVVTARGRKCALSVADRLINDRAFRARAAEWARGTPVRVVLARDASYKCLAKVVFRLGEYGVTRVMFDPPPR